MTRMAPYLLALTALLPFHEQVALAKADYAAYGSSARYLDVSAWDESRIDQGIDAWRFQWPHLTRDLSLSHQFVRLRRTSLIRCDIDALGWRKGWAEAMRGYPYAPWLDTSKPIDLLIVRLDWLMRAASDMTFLAGGKPSQAYYQLLLGFQPKTLDEFLKSLSVTRKTTGLEGAQVIEAGKSGVAFNRRLITSHADVRDWWETFDSKRASGKQDPTVDQFTFDAQEVIVPLEKTLTDGTYQRVRVQAYALTDGKGSIVNFADNDIVEDLRRPLNRASVRTMVSCVVCHVGGLNGNGSNLFVEYLKLDGQPKISFYSPRETERFNGKFLGSFGRDVRRANEDFAQYALDFLGNDPKTAVRDWVEVLGWYDEPLSLSQAARELYAEPEELRLALAYLSGRQDPKSATKFFDAAQLIHGQPISRRTFEDTVHRQGYEALAIWRAEK